MPNLRTERYPISIIPFENLSKAKLLKLQISTFGLFFLLCQYYDSIYFKVIESTTDILSEMKSLEADLERNKSLCLESCCRLELMKRQNVPKWEFSIFKVSFARIAPS